MRAVFFDLYNTLARFHPPAEDLQVEACRRLGIAASREGIALGYARADAYMASENARQPVRDRPREERRAFFNEYERLVLQGGGVEADLDMARRVWEELRRIPYGLALFEDAAPALVQLRRRGLTLGVLSNVDQGSVELRDGLGLGEYVDFLLTSREVGADKPHPAMFRAALARACAAPEEAVHVGDQVTSDVDGALAVGIHPVLLRRPAPAAGRGPRGRATDGQVAGLPAGVPVVRSLAELAGLLPRDRG